MISMTNENAELVASPIIPKIVISMMRDMMVRNFSLVMAILSVPASSMLKEFF
jgi:hypothetical protein